MSSEGLPLKRGLVPMQFKRRRGLLSAEHLSTARGLALPDAKCSTQRKYRFTDEKMEVQQG